MKGLRVAVANVRYGQKDPETVVRDAVEVLLRALDLDPKDCVISFAKKQAPELQRRCQLDTP